MAEAQKNRKRPKANARMDITNPYYRRVRAALTIEDQIYLWILRHIDGQDESEVLMGLLSLIPTKDPDAIPTVDLDNNSTTIADYMEIDGQSITLLRPAYNSITIADVGIDAETYCTNIKQLTLPPVEVLKCNPQRHASELTCKVLGFGKYWLRDLIRASPPEWVGKRRRYASKASMQSRRKDHAGEFDLFTEEERLFYNKLFPTEAREAINKGIYHTIFQDGVVTTPEIQEAKKYLLAPFEYRNNYRPPRCLQDIVLAIVNILKLAQRRKVYRLAKRYIRRGKSSGSELVQKRLKPKQRPDEDDADAPTHRNPYYYVTPLPCFGPPPINKFKPRRRGKHAHDKTSLRQIDAVAVNKVILRRCRKNSSN